MKLPQTYSSYQSNSILYNIGHIIITSVTLLTISAADVKISAAAIFFTAIEILVAVTAPTCGWCTCGSDPCVNPSGFSIILALHQRDLFRILHVQPLFSLALHSFILYV